MTAPELDKWASWLLDRRDGGDAELRANTLARLLPIRDLILDHADLRAGETLLDVGGGDGLVAFGAMDRLAGDGSVILSDVSEDLVHHSNGIAQELGLADGMSFVVARAEDLEPVPSGSVDVVTTRSVLIYVEDKAAAFRAFHRVLRLGGRISLFEPINNYFPWDPTEFWGYDATPVADLVEKIWAHEGWGPEQDAGDPMTDFNEKDLVHLAEAARFSEVHLELRVDVEPGSLIIGWDRLLTTSPNPNASSVGEMIGGALTPDEAARFEAHLRPQADAGRSLDRSAFAYLWASKP